MDYWVHLQIILFCLILGIGISLFLGARSYIKIALVVLLIYIPIQIYYSYKRSKTLAPITATIASITVPPAANQQLASQQQTITADGSLITMPGTQSAKGTSSVQAFESVPTASIPDYHPRKTEEGNRFATEKNLEDTKYSIFHKDSQDSQDSQDGAVSLDKPPFDGLEPKELLSRLNYIYYATAQPAKRINYHDFKTHADQLLDTDGTKLSNDDPKLQSYAAGFYPQLTTDQIDTRDCLNYGSGAKSCFQSKQLFYNAARDFNILDKGVNMENANLVVREDFSMPKNLEAITSRPLPLDLADRNTGVRVLFVNAPNGNLDRPLNQESNESLGRKLNETAAAALCHNCKLAVCRDDYCGLQNALFM
jgi:hypothetical protein